MNEVLRVVRTRPDGSRTQAVLTEDLLLRIDDGGPRSLPGPDLVTALAAAPEMTALDNVTRIEITCAGPDVRSTVLASLHDDDPAADFDESAWPDDTDDLPETDEWPIDAMLRHRWLTVDGETHHLLPVDHTRVVQVENGEITSGDELASASWSFDGDIMSSTGRESLLVVAGDTLVRQNLGDDFPEVEVEQFDGDVVAAITAWLDDNAYAPAYLVRHLPAPGLTADERSTLNEVLRQDMTAYVEPDDVLDRLVSNGARRRFRDALADPGSTDGEQIYGLLRSVIADEKPVDDLLGTLV